MTQEVVWGVADLLCRHCQSVLLLTSPPLEAAESNLTGKTAAQCSSCGHRTEVRDLPQVHQSLIAARLRLLLDEDDLIHMSEALDSLALPHLDSPPASRDQGGNQANSPTHSQRREPSRHATPEDLGGQRSTKLAEPSANRPRVVRSDPDAVKWQRFMRIAKLSPPEAKAVAATMDSNVGEPVRDKAKRASFSAVRIRHQYFVAATETEIFTDLTRYKNSGRTEKIGFSREEVAGLAFGISAGHEVLEVSDSLKNLVALLKFELLNKGRFGSVEVFRPRPAPVK